VGGGEPAACAAGGSFRLVATDLDGTLLRPDGTVSRRTVEAVRAARRAGIYVVPVTGRPPRATRDIALEAGLGPFAVCANGAAVVDLPSMDVVEQETIEARVAGTLVASLRVRFPGALFAAEQSERLAYEAGFFEVDRLWQDLVHPVDDILEALAPATLKLIVRQPGASAADLLAHLANGHAAQMSVTSSGLDWVEIAAAGVSKAYGTRRVCDRLGVQQSEVLAVGDYYNDLPLLAWAGGAAAPANALPEVLAAARQVVPPNSEDGVAQLLEALVASVPGPT
jgi:Cof subfamily protein (haloacid dehalogenase superfamily)